MKRVNESAPDTPMPIPAGVRARALAQYRPQDLGRLRSQGAANRRLAIALDERLRDHFVNSHQRE
jgi:hypothetical protein